MIRISAHNEAWQAVEINIDGDIAPMKVRYRLLDKRETAEWSARRLSLAKAAGTDNHAVLFDLLLESLTPEHFAKVDAMLKSRIVAWDLLHEDGTPYPVNEETLTQRLDDMRFWGPLLWGLVDASSPSAAKKTVATGSTGGSTTSKPT